jgi:subtilase family serine protease
LKNHRRRWSVVLLALVAVGAAIAASAGSSGVKAAQHGFVSPANGGAALSNSIGDPAVASDGSVHFGCQLSTPAGCYGPDQIRAAYGIQPLLDAGYDGTGRTIAIVDAYGSPTLASDVATFDTVWGLPAPNLQVVAPFGIDSTTAANASGWAGETSLDVEWAHAVAPGAKILLVVSKSNDDAAILDATQWISDNLATDQADVVSQSFGEAEQCMDPTQLTRQHALFAKMTGQGITLLASSGDQGAGIPTCDGKAYFKATSTPASDPYVTSVGGTTLHADGVSGAYQSEATWNESAIFGDAVAGGGGVSVIYSRPSYQASVQKSTMRTVPDVSYNAAVFNGVIVRFNGSYFRFGGTSAGSPQWAGIVAIADQIAGGRIGSINQGLYDVGKNAKTSTYFHDVADGSNNSVPDLGCCGTPIDGFSAVTGYDLATGFGSPIASALAPYLAKNGTNGIDNGSAVLGSSNGHHGHKSNH